VAKLVPYKTVKSKSSKSIKGALKVAVGKNLIAANQLGSSLNSVGSITNDLVKISEAFRKTRVKEEKDERRQKRLEKDQAAEDRQEGKKIDEFNKSGKDKDAEKELKKKRKPKMSLFKKTGKGMGGFLLGFLGPVGGALASLAAAAASYKLMQYFSKPENTKKIKEFIEKASFVFKKLFGWAGQLIDATMTAIDQLFGKEKTIGERLLGFGKIATAIGTQLMLLKAYEAVGDFLDRDKPKTKRKKPDDVDPKTKKKIKPDEVVDNGKVRKATPEEIDLKKKGLNSDQIADYKKQVADGVDPNKALKKTKQNKVQRVISDKVDDVLTSKPVKNVFGFFQDLGTKVTKGLRGLMDKIPGVKELGEKLGKELAAGYKNIKKFAQKKFDDVVKVGKKLKGMYQGALKNTGNFFTRLAQRAKDAVVKKILEPALKYFEPALKKVKAVGGKIMAQLQKIPGYDKITKVLKKFGGEGSQGLLKKIGGKAVPILGGFVNMLFAYDRLASGDSIGGLLEGASGILDLSGAFGNAAGPPISMGIDAFMFARDFVPQIQQAEEAIVNKLGLGGIKSQIDSLFKSLPDLGTITKMVLGKKKEEDQLPEGDTINEEGTTVTTKKKQITAKLDIYGDGKAYINGNEVSLEEYQAFQEMSREEQLAKYGNQVNEVDAEEKAAGGLLTRVPRPAYFSAGGLADQMAIVSAYDDMIPIPFIIEKLALLPTQVAINTGGTEVRSMSSLTSRRL
tara:strand:- start:3752 stop:5956 length:2205 start_codon:yes stop_codon:yes gene_type:complete